MGRFCIGKFMVKNIFAPEIAIPSLWGVVRIFSTMPNTIGTIIIKI
jgi:hypothetical protein